jgi:hypothetical protein
MSNNAAVGLTNAVEIKSLQKNQDRNYNDMNWDLTKTRRKAKRDFWR